MMDSHSSFITSMRSSDPLIDSRALSDATIPLPPPDEPAAAGESNDTEVEVDGSEWRDTAVGSGEEGRGAIGLAGRGEDGAAYARDERDEDGRREKADVEESG